MGSQWWCLTRATLRKILNDPNRKRYDRYFAKTWIPDESYFQTLARVHSERIEARSLTMSRFDADGKPFILYSDMLPEIEKTNFFLARKAWAKDDPQRHLAVVLSRSQNWRTGTQRRWQKYGVADHGWTRYRLRRRSPPDRRVHKRLFAAGEEGSVNAGTRIDPLLRC